jgi:hypothetical protein
MAIAKSTAKKVSKVLASKPRKATRVSGVRVGAQKSGEQKAMPERSPAVRKAAAKAAIAASAKTGRSVDSRVKKLAES